MRSHCRRVGVAAVILAGLSLALTGCLAPRYHESWAPPAGPGCSTCQDGPAMGGRRLGGRVHGRHANMPPGMVVPGQPGDMQRVGFFQDGGVLQSKDGTIMMPSGPAHPMPG